MVTNCFENKDFIEKIQDFSFCLLSFGGWEGFVPNAFPSSSQDVPIVQSEFICIGDDPIN
jgi:hypothetical protein